MNTKPAAAGKGSPLGYAPIPKLIAKFAIPTVISLLVTAAYNITDQIFIGNIVGMYGNAATNVAFPVSTLLLAFSQLIGVGTSANFNLCMGARKQDKAESFLYTGLTLTPIVGLSLMAIVLLFKSPILMLCGATENVYPLAMTYLGITAFGMPFLLFSNNTSHLIRSDGSPTFSMFCTVSGAILNVGLDALFMHVFKWGIAGAAIATTLSQVVSATLCFIYLTRFKTFKLSFKKLGIKKDCVKGIVKLGSSQCLNQLIMMVTNIVMNNTLRHYGAMSVYGSDIPLAVSGVIAKLNSILTSFSIGIAQGCNPIFGFNMGAKNYKRVKKTYKTALVIALGVSFIFFSLFQIFPRQIVSIFGSGDELYFQFAEQYMRIFMMMVCVFGVQPLTVNYFVGTGNMRQSLILSLTKQGCFFLPALIILPAIFGLNGVLCSGPIADTMACLLAFFLVRKDFKRISKLEAKLQ